MVNRIRDRRAWDEGETLRVTRSSPPGRVVITEKESRDPRMLRLGEWLVQKSLISRSDLFDALNLCYTKQCRLGDAIVQLGRLPRACVEREAQALYESGALLERRVRGQPGPSAVTLRPRGSRRATPPPIPEDA
jgi:hypothetical protein